MEILMNSVTETIPVNYRARGSSVTSKPGEFFVVWNDDVRYLEEGKFGEALKSARAQAVIAWSRAGKYPADQYPEEISHSLELAHRALHAVYIEAGYSDDAARLLLETDRVALRNALNNALQPAGGPPIQPPSR
jgi:hypothetical protein